MNCSKYMMNYIEYLTSNPERQKNGRKICLSMRFYQV